MLENEKRKTKKKQNSVRDFKKEKTKLKINLTKVGVLK